MTSITRPRIACALGAALLLVWFSGCRCCCSITDQTRKNVFPSRCEPKCAKPPASTCEMPPLCYSYFPTCWHTWPSKCGPCPPPCPNGMPQAPMPAGPDGMSPIPEPGPSGLQQPPGMEMLPPPQAGPPQDMPAAKAPVKETTTPASKEPALPPPTKSPAVPLDLPAEKPIEKPAEMVIEKPAAEKPAEKPLELPAEKPLETPAAKSATPGLLPELPAPPATKPDSSQNSSKLEFPWSPVPEQRLSRLSVQRIDSQRRGDAVHLEIPATVVEPDRPLITVSQEEPEFIWNADAESSTGSLRLRTAY